MQPAPQPSADTLALAPANVFDDLPRTANDHFRLHFFGAVGRVIGEVARGYGSFEAASEQFPFLARYHAELRERGGDSDQSPAERQADWQAGVRRWAHGTSEHLPLRALEDAGLEPAQLGMLLVIGLHEEDARFGLLWDHLQSSRLRRPTTATLQAWWQDGPADGRKQLRALQERGLIEAVNPDDPRTDRGWQPVAVCWDVLRGERTAEPAPGLRYRPPEEATPLDEMIFAPELARHLTRLPEALAAGRLQALVLRGPARNGRRSVLAALGRQRGLGLLEIEAPRRADDPRWRQLASLAIALPALPVAVVELAPSETLTVPALPGCPAPLGVVLGRQGGLAGPGIAEAVICELAMPGPGERRRHWRRDGLPAVADPDAAAEAWRLTGGTIARLRRLAAVEATLAGGEHAGLRDIRRACRQLNHQALDAQATRLPEAGDWSLLAVAERVRDELAALEARCRQRERLGERLGPAFAGRLGAGVRALFSGASGTGKTMAARLLADGLGKDCYRLDLAQVVDKYIGETEKKLDQVFTAAEELDVVLLIDEGDALLGQRTGVQSSTDRYANLETNFLLQRLEHYEGVVLVTTNAGDRIDSAFQRRMDVVVEFTAPEAGERWRIWQLHLPPDHQVDEQVLRAIAGRCQLTGGQIRNAVLHAGLQALDQDGALGSEQLIEAVAREYRKLGFAFPLSGSDLCAISHRRRPPTSDAAGDGT